ncbi:MAG: ATP-binding protein [Gammaproteobacteria bacterium]|nr:ATP-binding protein [Gammaproteobacteria bacterium]MDE0452292.1 ATP-binding protein [Gammaproteobacteria bacterium]
MQKILKRQEIKYLQEWSSRHVHKPLVIRGARQVGKSTLVREFVRLADMPMVEVNFERNPEFREAFAERDPARIVSTLALLTAREIAPAATVLFLDEIQAAPEALVALRYFHEEMPQLRVVAAGSLMEFALADARFSMPVGRVEYLHLGPMEFEDFLEASGNAPLAAHLRGFSLSDLSGGENVAFPAAVHRRCLDLLRQYCVVGGLPEAVAEYVDADTNAGEEFARVSRVQQGIVSAYRDDFHKYGHGRLRDRIQLVFDKLPAMVGRKFKYVQVSRDHRAAELSDALRHLCLAGVATRITHTAANGVPLAAEANERHFKCLCMDVGLMCGALHLNVLDLARHDLTLINGGALAEQFVGQHLLFSGPRYQAPSLYYWVREARNAAAEIDYLMTAGQRIVPVEIKAGTTGSLRSLHQFLQEKQRDFGLRFNADVPSLLRDAKRLSNGTAIDYRLLSLPIYMAGQARRLVGEFDSQ